MTYLKLFYHSVEINRNMQSPLHFAARLGKIDIIKKIFEKEVEKNPKDENALTPFHWAAQFGHLAVCQLIMENLEDKNSNSNVFQDGASFASSASDNDFFSNMLRKETFTEKKSEVSCFFSN